MKFFSSLLLIFCTSFVLSAQSAGALLLENMAQTIAPPPLSNGTAFLNENPSLIDAPFFDSEYRASNDFRIKNLKSITSFATPSDTVASFILTNDRPTLDFNKNTAIAEFSRQHESGRTRFIIYGYPDDPSILSHLRKSTMLYATGDAESMVLCAVKPQGAIKFYTQSWRFPENQRMIINAQGNVGIGTPTPASRLQVAQGDIYIEDIQSGVIMKAPNGNCWRLTIDNDGNWIKNQITCPN